MPEDWRAFQAILGKRMTLLERLSEDDHWCAWLARDAQEQQVVVKVWPAWRGSHEGRSDRMMQESAAYARLQHPGIVPLLGYGEQGDWFWHIRPADLGQPLSELLGTVLEPERVVRWLRNLTVALAYAHQHGVIHAQLEPEYMWRQEDRVRISDFASTRPRLDRAQAGSNDLPSPRFMSPDQILGVPLSPGSNYFTLGSIAFELLSRRPLFEAEGPIQLIFKVIQEELPSFEHLPAPLGELLVRLLERDPKQRLSDPGEILRYLGGDAPSISGPEMQEMLADLRAEGQAVAENEVFTLDPARALEKLSQFRFPEPWEWLVSLCAAAAALQAEKLSLEWRKQRLTVTYHGLRLSQERLQNFWLSAYAGHQEGPGYLARGLASALTERQGGWVEVASSGWKLRTDRVQKERWGRALSTHLQVRLEGCAEPDWEQVRRRFSFTTLPVCWQGKWQSTIIANRPLAVDGFHLRVDLLEPAQWLAVVDGMSFPLEQVVFDSGRVVVWGPLRLDADRRSLLEDAQLAELRAGLKTAVEEAIQDFALLPTSVEPQPVRLYRRALGLWQESGQTDKIDQFSSAFLNLQDGGLTPDQTAEECFRRVAAWPTPPDKFWELARHKKWFALLEADWLKALEVSRRAFAQEHARLHWVLQSWLEWALVAPDVHQLGSLFFRFSDQRLDARFDPLLVERLPVEEVTDLQRESWLQLLPRHWTQSRLRLKRTRTNPSPE